MAVTYQKLWKLLIDRDMKKKDLIELCDISKYTISRMNNNENTMLSQCCQVKLSEFPPPAKINRRRNTQTLTGVDTSLLVVECR